MKYHIAIVTEGLRFNGNSLDSEVLGGSESGTIYLAENLAKRGHRVVVFCNCDSPNTYGNVTYLNLSDWHTSGQFLDLDVLIVSRHFKYLKTVSNARSIWYLCQDVMETASELPEHLYKTDKIVVLSNYQRRLWEKSLPEFSDILTQNTNGVDVRRIALAKTTARKRPMTDPRKFNLVYTSRPERGLEHLLKMWPRILKNIPNAHLHVTYYGLQDLRVSEDIQQLHNRCLSMCAEFPESVSVIQGGLSKFNLFKLLWGCQALLYPVHFPEISCINALEAMATQTHVITTKAFALEDTVSNHGVLIEGKPYQSKYQDDFVAAVCDIHVAFVDKSDEVRLRLAANRATQEFSWEAVAARWETSITDYFDKRSSTNVPQIIRNLIYHDDVVAAQTLLRERLSDEGESCPELIRMLEECDKRCQFIEMQRPDEYADRGGHFDPGANNRFVLVARQIESFLERRESAKTLLDLGCNLGDFSAWIAQNFSRLHVTGVDWSQACVEEANHAFIEKAEFKTLGVSERLSFNQKELFEVEGKYDIVFAGEVMEHIRNTSAFITQLESLCNDGGLIIITTPTGPWEAISVRSNQGFQSHHLHHFEIQDLQEIFVGKRAVTHLYSFGGTSDRGELLGNWVTCWTNSSSAQRETHSVDYAKKLYVGRPYQGISLCMIGKNEEDNIHRCLKSLHSVVDEVIFVDTGSKDQTLAFVESIVPEDKLTVVQHPWAQDFSEARNIGLGLSKESWVLWVDCDEKLVDGQNLKKYLNSSVINGYVIHQCHLMLDHSAFPDTPIRLFRKSVKGIEPVFRGVIHEHCESAMDVPITPSLLIPDVKIAHYGYLQESQRRAKCQHRNMAMLLKDRQQNPDRRLGLILLQRDYINMIKWDLERVLSQGLGRMPERTPGLMRTICQIFRTQFQDPEKRDHLSKLSFTLYQESLGMLHKFGLFFDNESRVPVLNVPFVLGTGENTEIKQMFFLEEEEASIFFKEYLAKISPKHSVEEYYEI